VIAQHYWATFRQEQGVKSEAGTSAAAKNHALMDVASKEKRQTQDQAAAGVEPHAIIGAASDQAISIMLDLVHPRRAALTSDGGGREARDDEAGWKGTQRQRHCDRLRSAACWRAGSSRAGPSAPTMPQRVYTIRRQSERTTVSSDSQSALNVELW
jgi:hypothetical protein